MLSRAAMIGARRTAVARLAGLFLFVVSLALAGCRAAPVAQPITLTREPVAATPSPQATAPPTARLPTRIASTSAPTVTAAPATYAAVEAWLLERRQMAPGDVAGTIAQLRTWGWLPSEADEEESHFITDLALSQFAPYWIVRLITPGAPAVEMAGRRYWPGNLILLNETGVVYRFYETPDGGPPNGRYLPRILLTENITYDPKPDLLLAADQLTEAGVASDLVLLNQPWRTLQVTTRTGWQGLVDVRAAKASALILENTSDLLFLEFTDPESPSERIAQFWEEPLGRMLREVRYLAELSDMPYSFDGLFTWFLARVESVRYEDLAQAMLARGWLREAGDLRWQTIANVDETYFLSKVHRPFTSDNSERYSGDRYWLYGDLDLAYEWVAPNIFNWLIELVTLADLTGDGRPEIVVRLAHCGVDSCVYSFEVLTAGTNGARQLVQNETVSALLLADDPLNAVRIHTDHQGYPELLTADANGAVLSVSHGMVRTNAGYGRPYTEHWAYDAALDRIVLNETIPGTITLGHHALYEANELARSFLPEDRALALEWYRRVIEDENLVWVEPPEIALAESAQMAARRFAVFRLTILMLESGDIDTARGWVAGLSVEDPGQLLAAVLESILMEWTEPASTLGLCLSAVARLERPHVALGAISYMGYANPVLSVDDLCR